MSHKEPTHDWLPADIDKMSDLLPIIGAPGFQVCLAPDPPKKTKGRATSIVGPGVSQSNVYNGLDTRVGSTTNSVGRSFLRDGAYVTDPVLSDGAATYAPGVSERRRAATTFLHSGTKNADAQSGTGQTVAASRQYDAFGNLIASTGTWNGPFGYAGGFGYQEDATGLRLLGHSYYDSSTGRFLTRDPINDGRNWYLYCDNDPLSRQDRTGLAWHDPVSVTVTAGFGGKVIAFGDFPWMPGDGWRDTEVPRGYVTHPDMDVDMVLIIHPDGRTEFVFLPGNGIVGDGKETRSCYYIDADGKVRSDICQTPCIPAGPGLFQWWDQRWSDWIEEAYGTGFPKGYGPKQSPFEPCLARW
ncbi:MAG: RHS repeat-associated core domain-containing protein [Fimbriimonadaceae bacterium]|nr:RHS repeat-associated core domain-containing protein [Fimbriimonadaceae bacterium]